MLNQTKILRWRELEPIIGCSRMTVWRMEREGTFPKRIQINSGSVGWLEHEVEAWLADRMANRVEDSSAPARPDEVYDESLDGDHTSALASAGWGTDEDYGGTHERF